MSKTVVVLIKLKINLFLIEMNIFGSNNYTVKIKH